MHSLRRFLLLIRPGTALALLLCVSPVLAAGGMERRFDAGSNEEATRARLFRPATDLELPWERPSRSTYPPPGTASDDRGDDQDEDGDDAGEPADDDDSLASRSTSEPRHSDPSRRRLPARRLLEARGPPAVGFPLRSAALTISWLTSPLRFNRHEWRAAGVFLAIPTALILSGSDDATSRMFNGNRSKSKDRLAELGDQLGEAPLAAGVLAGFGAYGYVFDDPRGVHTLEAGIISIALSGALTTAIKGATGRARPTLGLGSKHFVPFGGDMSFPSGHATVAFSLAGTINYHYPGWIGRTALLAACTTAFARVYNFHHWTSDVVFAAMVSSATAHSVSRLNLAAAHGDLTFEPLFDGDAPGAMLRKRF